MVLTEPSLLTSNINFLLGLTSSLSTSSKCRLRSSVSTSLTLTPSFTVSSLACCRSSVSTSSHEGHLQVKSSSSSCVSWSSDFSGSSGIDIWESSSASCFSRAFSGGVSSYVRRLKMKFFKNCWLIFVHNFFLFQWTVHKLQKLNIGFTMLNPLSHLPWTKMQM